MSRRAAGVALVAVAAVLYAARHLAAATFMSSLSNWNAELFASALQYTGQGIVTWAIVALVAGVAYLVWAEIRERR